MDENDLLRALKVVHEIAGKLGVPPPRVSMILSGTPYYSGGTIYLPSDLPSDMVERVAAHEMAHHLHEYFKVPISEREAEDFASTFEEVWVRMSRGFKYPVFVCPNCGFRMFAYSKHIKCPKCGTEYHYNYPSPGLDRAVGLAIVSGIAAYFIATKGKDYIRKYLRREPTPEQVAGLAAGLAGFLAGLIL